MSGPTTVIFTAEPATVLLAAAAIRAAEAVQAGYQEAARLRDEHRADHADNRAAQAAASAAGQKALADAVDRAEQRYSRLCQLTAPYAATAALRTTPIAAPVDASPLNIAAYLQQQETQCSVLESALKEQLGESPAPMAPGLTAINDAAAVVLEQSLKDLGYQVEAISDTLFVDGGVVHFRRADWGDYQVRLRLNAQESRANFNVVRAIDAGDNERSVLDHLAEDRWCAEFPALLDALAKRGLHLAVTRRLQAGELPVQLVDRDKLPSFADAENPANASAPRHKEMR